MKGYDTKGFRFYQEFKDKGKRRSAGTVVAVFGKIYRGAQGYQYEALGAVYDRANSPVAGTSVSPEYLSEKTKRISAEKAKRIHPELFKRLKL